MEGKCRKYWQAGVACPAGQAAPGSLESTTEAPPGTDHGSPRGIAFGVDSRSQAPAQVRIPVPGYDAPGLPLKPVRDPSLSLIALSGLDPSGPVMVEVPLVQNNSSFIAANVLAGRRVGFAERYGRGGDHEPIEHRAPFRRALDILRQAGVQLLPVPAQRVDETLQFNLHTHNEIDELVNEHRLDALVSDSRSAAFHAACWHGYPVFGEPLGDGAMLWFYGARWSKDSLAALVQGYRSARRLPDGQDGLPAALNNPTE
nr:hypothetical protein [Pseudomonas extremaustralis]